MNGEGFFDLADIAFDVHTLDLLRVLAVGGLAVVLLWLLRRGLWVLLKRRTYRDILQRSFPIAATLFWTLFALWSFDQVFVHDSMRIMATISLLVVLTAGFAWYGARDYMAGIVLKSQSSYEVGRTISVGDQRGAIRHRGTLAIELESADGRRWRMPWSKLSSIVHARENPAAMVHRHSFRVTVAANEDEAALRHILSGILRQMPWTVLRQEPRIELESETPDSFVFLVTVFIIDSSYGAGVERSLRRVLASENLLSERVAGRGQSADRT